MPFQESTHPKVIPLTTLIRDLGVRIEGSWLAPVLGEFQRELAGKGIVRLRPTFYLSTEWGVAFDTIGIALPFYLAQPELIVLHGEHAGHLEGATPPDLLRYLRHEMGHVVNYAYQLYAREDWTKLFGSIDAPYIEEFRPQPFNRRFVRHLPGWYAQKHPDEDWAETFAIWLTPGYDWATAYEAWPEALAKLNYCERLLTELRDRDPLVTDETPDEPAADLTASLEEYFQSYALVTPESLPDLDGLLKTLFQKAEVAAEGEKQAAQSAAWLIRQLERELAANIYRWTGHFPERTRALLRRLAERAEQLQLDFRKDRQTDVTIELSALVTALAMNFVHYGSYAPA